MTYKNILTDPPLVSIQVSITVCYLNFCKCMITDNNKLWKNIGMKIKLAFSYNVFYYILLASKGICFSGNTLLHHLPSKGQDTIQHSDNVALLGYLSSANNQNKKLNTTRKQV